MTALYIAAAVGLLAAGVTFVSFGDAKARFNNLTTPPVGRDGKDILGITHQNEADR